MKSVEITPHNGKRVLKVLLNDYWYRSAMGFGEYTQNISSKTFRRVADNCKLYYLTDDQGNKYKLKTERVGLGYFFVIKPEQKAIL